MAYIKGWSLDRCRSHSCDQGQEAVKGSRAVLVSVKHAAKDNFQTLYSSQDVHILCVHIAYSVVKCVWSNSQGPVCSTVKVFLTPVAAVTTALVGVTTPCI